MLGETHHLSRKRSATYLHSEGYISWPLVISLRIADWGRCRKMANTANVQDHGEFWRPPLETRHEDIAAAPAENCARCGTQFVAGSRFCHICGTAREPQFVAHHVPWARLLDVHRMQTRLGLSLASMIAFVLGVICTLAAIGTGLIYTTSTVLDWQAVQIWRIEWLLAAVVALLAGILLRKAGGSVNKSD